MSAQNIKPEAVAPADAAAILAVVNGAATAEALAAQIELPNEPDIGLGSRRTSSSGARSSAAASRASPSF